MSSQVMVIPVGDDSQVLFTEILYGFMEPEYIKIYLDKIDTKDYKKSITRHDTPTFNFHLMRKDEGYWIDQDLSGSVILFAMKVAEVASSVSPPFLKRACSIDNAASGLFSISLTTAETGNAGLYYTEVEITWPNSTIRSFATFRLYINPDYIV